MSAKKNIKKPAKEAKKNVDSDKFLSVYEFRVNLKYACPKIWRVIQVPGNCNFYQLHLAIQQAIGWRNYHLHQFTMKDASGLIKHTIGTNIEIDFGFDDFERIEEKTVFIADFFNANNKKCLYEYDFGDSWEVDVTLRKIIPREKGVNYPRCISGKTASPPEDVGGIDGLTRHWELVKSPDDPEYKEYMEWCTSLNNSLDPNDFDPSKVEFHYF